MAGGGKPAVVEIADASWRVAIAPAFGCVLRSAVDVRSGAELCWRRPAAVTRPPTRALPPAGPESADTFMERFAGGWFPMFPSTGFTGELDGRQTHYHGELARLPWEVVEHGASWVETRVETANAPFAVVRRYVLADGALRIETEAANTGAAPASFTYGEHPCFPYATFAGGRLELEAREAWVPAPSLLPERTLLRVGEPFAWPLAPAVDGGTLDLSVLPDPGDGRHDQACVELASPLVRIGAPRHGRVLELEVDLATTPYALLWQDLGEAGVFAVEPASAPGRGVPDALAAGAVRRLSGGGFETAVTLRWLDG